LVSSILCMNLIRRRLIKNQVDGMHEISIAQLNAHKLNFDNLSTKVACDSIVSFKI
jgi:hypothetical protein